MGKWLQSHYVFQLDLLQALTNNSLSFLSLLLNLGWRRKLTFSPKYTFSFVSVYSRAVTITILFR